MRSGGEPTSPRKASQHHGSRPRTRPQPRPRPRSRPRPRQRPRPRPPPRPVAPPRTNRFLSARGQNGNRARPRPLDARSKSFAGLLPVASRISHCNSLHGRPAALSLTFASSGKGAPPRPSANLQNYRFALSLSPRTTRVPARPVTGRPSERSTAARLAITRPSTCMHQKEVSLGVKLLAAVHEGDSRRARRLINAGADVNYSGCSVASPLYRAVAKSDWQMVSLLLNRGADVNARNCHGYSPLHIAAYHDTRGRMLSCLIGAGAKLDIKTRTGRTPLHVAAETGNLVAVKTLLASGANKHLRDSGGLKPSNVARRYAIKAILNKGGKRAPSAKPKSKPCFFRKLKKSITVGCLSRHAKAKWASSSSATAAAVASAIDAHV